MGQAAKAGKVPEVLTVFNTAWSAPQKCRIWNNGQAIARIFSPWHVWWIFCFFVSSSTHLRWMLCNLLSRSFNWGRCNLMIHLQDLHLQDWTHRQFAGCLNVSLRVFDPKAVGSLCSTKQIGFSVVMLPWGSYVCCLFLKTIFLKEIRLKQFCLPHPFSNKTFELLG